MKTVNNENLSFICFGGEDWWYHNRGHIDMQLMRRFSQTGKTLYINSIVMQKPNLKKNTAGGRSFLQKLLRKSRSIFKGLTRSDAGFWVYSPISFPVHHVAWLRPLANFLLRLQTSLVCKKLGMSDPIVWVACPAVCDVAIRMEKKMLIYQRTDRFEDYPNVDQKTIKGYDEKLKNGADLTIFVSHILFEEESVQCKRAIYLDHGVDFDLFADAHKDSDIPEDIIKVPKPIAGFFGGIDDHTFDIAFVEKVVDLVPDFSFVFIGQASADVRGLKNRKNVWFLGKKDYNRIAHYGKYFDVCLMPWRQNRWITACNPIKLKEYLALGKPIVSTHFEELTKYQDVTYEADTPGKFADCIKQALVSDCPELVFARREKVKNASWDNKAEMIVERIFASEQHGTLDSK